MKKKKLVDNVNHPAHYKTDKVECIEAMESFLTPAEFQGHCKATAVKYIWRAGKKDNKLQDAKKAAWYIGALINSIENENK